MMYQNKDFTITDKVMTFMPHVTEIDEFPSEILNSGDIEKVYIPKTVKEIKPWAFAKCESLRVVVFDENSKCRKIGKGAFSACRHLHIFDFGKGSKCREIEEGAFADCFNLEYIEIPKSVKKIGERAFMNSGLREMTMPNYKTEIGDFAFYDCRVRRIYGR